MLEGNRGGFNRFAAPSFTGSDYPCHSGRAIRQVPVLNFVFIIHAGRDTDTHSKPSFDQFITNL